MAITKLKGYQTRAQVRKSAQKRGKNPNSTPLEKKVAKGAGFVLKHGVPLAVKGPAGFIAGKVTGKLVDKAKEKYWKNRKRREGLRAKSVKPQNKRIKVGVRTGASELSKLVKAMK